MWLRGGSPYYSRRRCGTGGAHITPRRRCGTGEPILLQGADAARGIPYSSRRRCGPVGSGSVCVCVCVCVCACVCVCVCVCVLGGLLHKNRGYYTAQTQPSHQPESGARAAPKSRTTRPSTPSTGRISRCIAYTRTHAQACTHMGRKGRAGTHVATIGSFVFERYAWTTWNL
jgi:hypothetical protein